MDRFENGGFPIIRIGNRMFTYLKRKKLIVGYDSSLSTLGFKEHGVVFERNIEENEIESAYYVIYRFGIYLNYKVEIIRFNEKNNNEIIVLFSDEDGKAAGIEPTIDHMDKNNTLYWASIPESEIKEIYEIRIPEAGFAFESPKIVYHKKDGIWLPYHELGAQLEKDEWL